MKLKKTGIFLTTLLLTTNLFSKRLSNSPFPKDKKFEDYKTVEPEEKPGYLLGKSYFLKIYDTNKDEIFDVVLAYKPRSVDGITTPRENPAIYCFNFKQDPKTKKQDNKLDDNEIWLDPFEDGWQGDELTLQEFREMRRRELFKNRK